jgi:hypothetical protein
MIPTQMKTEWASFQGSSTSADDVVVQDTLDQILSMKEQEQGYRCDDYLQDNSANVDEGCRVKMCEWCNQMVDYFKLSRRTVQVTISCFDRFMATPQGRPCLKDKALFQLACITCLYTMIKTHESMEIDVSLMSELSHDAYSEQRILDMEYTILFALKWRVNPPTVLDFCDKFVQLLPSHVAPMTRKYVQHLVTVQAELSLVDYSLCMDFNPSEVALASVINALCVATTEIPVSSSQSFLMVLVNETKCQPNSEEISEIMDQLLFLPKGKCPTLDSSTRQCVLESKVTTSERHATSRKSPKSVGSIKNLFIHARSAVHRRTAAI